MSFFYFFLLNLIGIASTFSTLRFPIPYVFVLLYPSLFPLFLFSHFCFVLFDFFFHYSFIVVNSGFCYKNCSVCVYVSVHVRCFHLHNLVMVAKALVLSPQKAASLPCFLTNLSSHNYVYIYASSSYLMITSTSHINHFYFVKELTTEQ